ncbi:flagellar hook-associated protein FlgK [Caulobacter mirabilis]|uniref:Flagellar hook-associated protein 1 n=1 Tax=Caulobacter mirabilis TaxID=69666 RepID=A0A2D2AV07_9CAUL|nr:flagellar hook-associated protein FlgK [Caulobacter mirabilis]ATQ41839.1 flagellar hook-associated protein FlgK [Caulobacter mirabilis]
MSLSAIMSAANSGLNAAQTGLRAVSDNIANVNTPGYVRKLVDQRPLVSAGMGVGVDIAQIRRAADQFLQRAALTARASSAEANVVSQNMDRVQALFGDPSGKSSFFSRLDDIYTAFSAAANDPSSAIRRDQAIDGVSDFLSEAKRIGASLKDLQTEADSRISANIERVNQLLGQIEGLNGDISRAKIQGGDATGSENIQSQLIDELSGLMDVNVSQRGNGGVVIRASDGAALAGAGGAAKLSYVRKEGVSGEIAVTLPGSSQAQTIMGKITGGEIRGLMDLRDKELPAISEQLSEFVTRAVDELNRAHNASSPVPAPNKLTGRNTGLDLSTAVGGFTGKTTVAVLDANGMITRQVEIDFDAGTMSVGGVPGSTPFTPASFLGTLNTALGGQATASFANGALSLTGAAGRGVAISDDATTPAQKAGKGFSHFFGLNDLVTSKGFTNYETGLKPTDAHGFTAGQTISLRIADGTGSRIRDVSVAVPAGGTMQDLLDALNSPTGGVGLYGQYSLDADGALSFKASGGNGASISVVQDNTVHGGPGGPSMSQLFGIGAAQRSGRINTLEVRTDIAANPASLGLAKLDLAQAAAGKPALAVGDGRGAILLSKAGETMAKFDAVGGTAAASMTVSRYASEFAGSIGRKSDAAASREEIAKSVATEANARRTSAEAVNLDQELISMTTYQQAFAASARLVQASKDMYDVLLAMTGN